MTNHVHMIISRNSSVLLEEIVRDMKKFTASKLVQAIEREPESRREWMLKLFAQAGRMNSNNTNYQLWQQDKHPIACGSQDILRQKMNYIHNNPVRAGFVDKEEDWIYSSAGDYRIGRKGLIEMSYV